MVLIPAFKGCDLTVDQSADVGQCVSALSNLKELFCLHRNHFSGKSMHCEGCTLACVECLLALISALKQIYKCLRALKQLDFSPVDSRVLITIILAIFQGNLQVY